MFWTGLWVGIGVGVFIGFVGCCLLFCLEDETDWQQMIDGRQKKRQQDWELEPITPAI